MADPNAKALTPTSVYRHGTAPMPAITATPLAQKPKLLDQVRQAIRTRHYSSKTEGSYVHRVKRFIFFHVRAKRPHSLPVVLTRQEVKSVLGDRKHRVTIFVAFASAYDNLIARKIHILDSQAATRGRPTNWLRASRSAQRSRAQIPERGKGVGMGVGIFRHRSLR